MIVDLGHSAKRTDFVFFDVPPPRLVPALGVSTPRTQAAIAFGAQTPKRVRVRWYFCPPNAKPIPGGSIWASTDWSSIYELADATMGEVPRTGTSRGNSGLAPTGASGQRVCGRPIDFLQPKVWNPNAPISRRGPTGLLVCCNPGMAGAIAWCGRSIAVGAIGLTATIPPIEPAEAVEFTSFIPAEGDTEWGIASVVATMNLAGDVPQLGDVELGIASDGDGLGLVSETPAAGDVELFIASAPGDVGLVGETPAIGEVVFGIASSPSVVFTGEVPAAGDIGLDIASISFVGLVGDVAAGDVGLVGETPAAGEVVFGIASGPPVVIVGEVPQAGEVVFGIGSIEPLVFAGDVPAAGDVGLVGEVAAGDVELSDVAIAAGDVELSDVAIAAGDVELSDIELPAGDVPIDGETPAEGEMGFDVASIETIGMVGDDPAAGDVELSDVDVADGDQVLTTVDPAPPTADGSIGLDPSTGGGGGVSYPGSTSGLVPWVNLDAPGPWPGIVVGMTCTGPGVPGGTTVTAGVTSGGVVALSASTSFGVGTYVFT